MKLFRRIPAVLIVLAFQFALASSSEPVSSIDVAEFSIAGFSLGNSEVDAASAFGKPAHVRDDASPSFVDESPATVYGVTHVWEKLEIYFLANEARNLKCRTSKFSTPAGLRVGDTLDRAAEVYGAVEATSHEGVTRSRYNVRGTNCYLVLLTRFGTIIEIELWFDYT